MYSVTNEDIQELSKEKLGEQISRLNSDLSELKMQNAELKFQLGKKNKPEN